MGKVAVTTSLVLLLGCSGGAAGGAAAPAGPRSAEGSAEATPRGEPAAPPAPLSEQECVALLDHYLDVELAERRATQPAEAVPTDEQVEEIRLAMRQDGLASCLGAPRDGYDCAMQASTPAGIERCVGAEGAP